jgi:hypothetical protein
MLSTGETLFTDGLGCERLNRARVGDISGHEPSTPIAPIST